MWSSHGEPWLLCVWVKIIHKQKWYIDFIKHKLTLCSFWAMSIEIKVTMWMFCGIASRQTKIFKFPSFSNKYLNETQFENHATNFPELSFNLAISPFENNSSCFDG